MSVIDFDIIGVPAEQGSKRAFVNRKTGQAHVVDDNPKKLKDWRYAVAEAGRRWQQEHGPVPLLDEPIQVKIEFWLPKPKSYPAWRFLPDKKPDIDKLMRAMLDALTGVLWVDDARVVEVYVSKEYAVDGPPGAHVTVNPLGSWERAESERRAEEAKAP